MPQSVGDVRAQTDVLELCSKNYVHSAIIATAECVNSPKKIHDDYGVTKAREASGTFKAQRMYLFIPRHTHSHYAIAVKFYTIGVHMLQAVDGTLYCI